ncbi:hypothetical protein Goshw_010701 [Gossypium schwendimanii]|uniref:Uncharacterized protein n=1 Tax=Gossypium schwendimanii TaxID=34291 RepID=A0A7J9LV86_GOSSC|nr:hypothetical protein [Gossypium schwendimanii]
MIHVQLLNRELVMKKRFLDKVEDNAADFTRISVTQNNLKELK